LADQRLKVAGLHSLMRDGELMITVLGLGRIGLPTAALFSKAGAKVTGVDIRKDVVDQTNSGVCRLVDEPGLPEVVKESVESGNLRACLLYTSPSPRDLSTSRMPSSA